jgi:ribose transport system permease protein
MPPLDSADPTAAMAPPDPAGAPKDRFGLGGRVKTAELLRDYGLVVVVVALFVILSLTSPTFFSENNFRNILQQWAPTGIMVIGGSVVLIGGGFDLSIAGIYVVGAIVACKVGSEVGPIPGLFAGVIAGGILGLINGLLITKVKINDFVCTIATGIVFTGGATAISNGFGITVTNQTFGVLGQDKFLTLTWAVWIFFAFALLVSYGLRRTTLGRYVYAVGGNPEAARLSGLRSDRIRTGTYVLSGISGGIAGMLIASLTMTASPNISSGIDSQVFAAMLVGGNSVMGGSGKVSRAVLGIALLALITNGLNLLGVNPTYQEMISGGIILLAVGSDVWLRRYAK